MRLIKMVLLMLFFSVFMFAADKPAWVVKNKTLDLPEYENYNTNEIPNYDPKYKIQFSPKDEIMLSYFQRSKQPVLTIKDNPETSGLSFNVLLFAKEDGKLINKTEWPVVGELDWIERLFYGSRIYSLSDSGYVGIFNKHLQVLDPSLNVIRNRLLERLPDPYGYNIFAPSHGTFFALQKSNKRYSGENDIIDSDTFKTVFKVSGGIVDIWGDTLLMISLSEKNDIDYLYEKKIGSSSDGFHLKIDNFTDAKFLYNGSTIVLSYKGRIPPYAEHYWFTIENGKVGNPVFVEGGFATSLVAAHKVPVVAINVAKLRSFDRGANGRINVYDIYTQQKLLQTKTYNDNFDYALSSDGQSLAVFIHEQRKIELYKVPAPGEKKK